MPSGGKRAGAGRKKLPPGTAKTTYATKLCPEVVAYLRSRENAAATIEGMTRRTKEFKVWKAGQ